jgi:cytochrome c553
MKTVNIKIALLAAICALVGPAAGGEPRPANVRNCTWCHGTSGQGYASAPRIAGQRPAYTEKELRAFHGRTRDNPRSRQYMWGAAENLNRWKAQDLAAYFAAIPGKPAKDGYRDLVAEGRTIYQLGIPDANIVSCVVCHGPNGEGVRDIPRLSGLSYAYLRDRLYQWIDGYHATAAYPMPKVARSLSPAEIEALASYLSFAR